MGSSLRAVLPRLRRSAGHASKLHCSLYLPQRLADGDAVAVSRPVSGFEVYQCLNLPNIVAAAFWAWLL